MRRATVAAPGVVLVLLLSAALTGCSGGNPDGPKTAAPPSTVQPASQRPIVKNLTGTQLKTMLVTAVPKDFTADPGMTRDTGNMLHLPSAGPAPTKSKCDSLETNSFVTAARLTRFSFARLGFNNAKKDGTIAGEIDVFANSDAQTVMKRMAALLTLCKSYTATYHGTKFTEHLVASKLPGLGSEAIRALVTSPFLDGGTTMVIAESGNTIVTTFYSSPGSDKGAGAVTMATSIMKKLRAAQT